MAPQDIPSTFIPVPSWESYSGNFGYYRRIFHDVYCKSLVEYNRVKLGRVYRFETYTRYEGCVLDFELTPDLVEESLKHVIEVTITTIKGGKERAIKRKRFSYDCLGLNKYFQGHSVDVHCWDGSDLPIDFPNKVELEEWFTMTKELELAGFRSDDYLIFEDVPGLKDPVRNLCEKFGLPAPERPSEDHDGYMGFLSSKLISSMKDGSSNIDCLPWNSPVSGFAFREGITKRYNTRMVDERPKILQLGCPNEVIEELPINDKGLLTESVLGGVFGSLDYSSKLVGRRLQPEFQKEAEREGPGRKQKNPMKATGPLDREAPLNMGIKQEDEDLFIELLDHFPGSLDEMDSDVSFLLRFYSRISREIVMNAMDKSRTREFCWFSSGFKGVSVLMAPGPPLRTEINVVHVKICSKVPGLQSDYSHDWRSVGDHYESRWLTVDTERLNSWTRCYDKVRMAFTCLCEAMYNPGEILAEIRLREETSKNPALLSMIMLEDKLTTSQTIENSRYVLMKSLGDKRVVDLVGKFPERINSAIQAHILRKIMNFVDGTLPINTTDILKLERRFTDGDQKKVLGMVPRLILFGGSCSLGLSINEIYLGCMYNTNRQNKTQDSFEILKKILKLESAMSREMESRPLDKDKSNHLFGVHTWENDVEHCLKEKPEEHYYSILASQIGHKLLCEKNKGFYDRKKMNKILNKTLDKFATFKASIEDVVDEISKEGDFLDRSKVLGVRSKCVVYADVLCAMGKLTLGDIVREETSKDGGFIKVLIQIFKKNQWGGVREILILKLASRICVNLCESIARLLCESDEREMLTCGSGKQSSMRQDHDDLMKEMGKGTRPLMIRRSADMTRWCQKFVNWIFSPLYDNIGDDSIKNVAKNIIVSHMAKIIEYPRELVKMWLKYPELKHEDESLQKAKEKFLEDLVPNMMNISNMGQGIYHFSSSVLALASTEFSDQLIKITLKNLNIPQTILWRTRKSSDDIGEQILLDMDDKSSLIQLWVFMACRRWANRLFSMEESIKTASGVFLYEFNSTFMMNTDCLTPTIKYALTACGQMNTDSFTESVSESFSRIRQLFENGSSLDQCREAHTLNSEYLEGVFSVSTDQVNDPERIFNIPRHYVPYDLGVYPMFDVSLMVTMGPEWYNYRLFQNSTEESKGLFKIIYGVQTAETVANLFTDDEEDQPLFWDKFEVSRKRNPLRIPQGFSKQLQAIKNRVKFDAETLKSQLITNYLLLIRNPLDYEEARLKIQLKLLGLGAKKAVRRTSEVIYLGRLGAFVSAEVFEGKTYADYILDLRNRHSDVVIEENSWFPKSDLYSSVRENMEMQSKRRRRLTRSPTTLSMSSQKFPQWASYKTYLYTCFGVTQEDESLVNLELFRTFFPFEFNSFYEFDDSCKSMNLDPVSVISETTCQFECRKSKSMHAITMCQSTTTLTDTLGNIRSYCRSVDKIYGMEVSESVSDPYSLVCDLADSVVLSLKGLLDIGEEERMRFALLREYLIREQMPLSAMMKKALCLVILFYADVRERGELIKINKLSLSWYQQSQRRVGSDWVGDLHLCVKRNSMISLCEKDGIRFVQTYGPENREWGVLLSSGLKELGWDPEDLLEERWYRQGHIIFTNNKFKIASRSGEGLVIKQVRSGTKPKIPNLDHLEFMINDKEQVVVSHHGTNILNYSVKIFGTSAQFTLSHRIGKRELLEEILPMLRQPEIESEEFELMEEYDDDFEKSIFTASIVEELEQLSSLVEELDVPDPDDTLETFADEEFLGFLPDDYVNSLEYRHKEKWTVRSYLVFLENCLFIGFEDDRPTDLTEPELFAKLNFIFNQKKLYGDPYIHEDDVKLLFEYYCFKLGVDLLDFMDHLNETVHPTLPCEIARYLSGDTGDTRRMRTRFRVSDMHRVRSKTLKHSERVVNRNAIIMSKTES